jgi:hypothetical protein
MSALLTGCRTCGKLVVYTARFFALRVSLVRVQHGPPVKPAGPFESCPQLRKLVSENIL